MNVVDGHVTKVLRVWHEPTYKNLPWLVEVSYWDDGGLSDRPTELMFKTEQEALAIDVGYVFQH